MSGINIMTEASATIKRLMPENTAFSLKNGFLAMTLTENGDAKEYDRVFLHRAFPFELLWEYISVLDADLNELGVIYTVDAFDADTVSLLKTELQRKYYEPKIAAIRSLKERYGFSYWQVTTTEGREVSFTMQDTFRSIIRIGTDKLILLDVDGNRFVIESVAALDRKSYKKVEIYL